MTDRYFVEGAEKINDSAETLNWYRNLYHCENETTERGIVARAINDILPEYVHQKAEIERLRKFLDMSRKVSLARRDENIRKDELMIKMSAELKTAKTEAIKEFAERLRNATMPVTLGGKYRYDVITKEGIDNLVKEMVGDTDV